MTSLDYSQYQRAVRWMEDTEALERDIPVTTVRRRLAREMGVPVGTLEYIRRGRLKGLQSRVEKAIDAALVRFLKRQNDRIAHELALAAARSDGRTDGPLARAMAARDALDTLIEEAK